MRLIKVTALFLALLFYSSFAYASSYQCLAAVNQSCACCRVMTYEQVFANPHTGWVTMPVATQPVRCSARL
ncbi:MAG: hypothetical protein P4L43_21180 [Syntrophobacteraceae bacterium]|nr:hypothetical protein [Syntrophobacteraceae bacterium]